MILLAVALMAIPASAVLKEQNLNQTLEVLCAELSDMHAEQKVRADRYQQMNKRYDQIMMKAMDRSHQIELMLYSQRNDYVFDLAYACNEATKLHDKIASGMMPFESFAQSFNDQITQYVQLNKALEEIPAFLLKTDEQKVLRDSCVKLSNDIATDMAIQRIQIEMSKNRSQDILKKTEELNAQALASYNEIRESIFVNGDDSYFSVLGDLPRYLKRCKIDLHDKYSSTGRAHSEWRGNLVAFLFIFIIFYIVVCGVASAVVMRYLIPKRFVTEEFKKKRSCYIVAASAALFAIVTFFISRTLQNHNFMIMASGLLSEYAWLIVAIVISLIIRLNGNVVMKGVRLYVPIMVVGFVVFVYRITFTPNTVVNLTFPLILLACTIWQLTVNKRFTKFMKANDTAYSWLSFVVMLVSLVMAWVGYTLMSVQVLIWWIMQLTLIQTITVIYDLLHRYERKHIPKDATIKRTWFYDFIYKVAIPIAATFSVAVSIYWAAKVFDLTEWSEQIFRYKFVDIKGVICLSINRLLAVIATGFAFNYVIYLIIQLYTLWKTSKTKGQTKVVSLSMNIIKYIGWGIYAYIVMVMLHVNRAGITLILTGLSTGIGFAMKDTLENLFYGLSLMSGRVKLGDVIECDGVRGRVTNINYQSTLVETYDGSVIAFLNSQLFNKNFKNMTRNHGYEMVKIPVGVAYGSQVNNVRQLIIDRLSDLDFFDHKKGIQVLFDNFGESSVDLTVVLWVPVKTRAANIATIKEAIYDVLNENHIEIPFPQTDVHIIPTSVES